MPAQVAWCALGLAPSYVLTCVPYKSTRSNAGPDAMLNASAWNNVRPDARPISAGSGTADHLHSSTSSGVLRFTLYWAKRGAQRKVDQASFRKLSNCDLPLIRPSGVNRMVNQAYATYHKVNPV